MLPSSRLVPDDHSAAGLVPSSQYRLFLSAGKGVFLFSLLQKSALVPFIAGPVSAILKTDGLASAFTDLSLETFSNIV